MTGATTSSSTSFSAGSGDSNDFTATATTRRIMSPAQKRRARQIQKKRERSSNARKAEKTSEAVEPVVVEAAALSNTASTSSSPPPPTTTMNPSSSSSTLLKTSADPSMMMMTKNNTASSPSSFPSPPPVPQESTKPFSSSKKTQKKRRQEDEGIEQPPQPPRKHSNSFDNDVESASSISIADYDVDVDVEVEREQHEMVVSNNNIIQPPRRNVSFADDDDNEKDDDFIYNNNVGPNMQSSSIRSNNNKNNNNTTTTRIERLVDKIQARKEQRMAVTRSERYKFLRMCSECAEKRTGGPPNIISFDDLIQMKDEVYDELKQHHPLLYFYRRLKNRKLKNVFNIFNLAIESCKEANDGLFYFTEFEEYYLKKKKSILKRKPLLGAIVGVFLYYFGSAVFFCAILGSNSTCPLGDDGIYDYHGWGTAIYFASATISTVGYGDVSFITDTDPSDYTTGRMFLATIFMIFAMLIAVTVFSTLAGIAMDATGLTDSGSVTTPLMQFLFNRTLEKSKSRPMSQQVKIVTKIRLFELTFYFVVLNLFAAAIAQIIFATGLDHEDDPNWVKWSWMTTIYWAVQTTTTIGYGDLHMPFNLRWFNLFFTIIGTTLAAAILGSLSSLKASVKDMRRFNAWKNREVSTRLIADMESDGDNEIDEYEFLVGSLITLEKITKDDVKEIMDKFRELAGDDQRITMDDIERHNIEVFGKKETKRSIYESSRGGFRVSKMNLGFGSIRTSSRSFWAASNRSSPRDND